MENNIVYYPLTHPQKAVWFTEKLHTGTSIGNVAGTLRIKGPVDLSFLEKAINKFIENNDSMRLHVVEVDGEPKQYISDYKYQYIDVFDFSDKGLEELYKWDVLQTRTPFSLIDSNLFYFAIVRVNDADTGFYIKCHHLIADAWSMSLLGSQIVNYYTTLRKGCDIFRVNPSYIDYVVSEVEYKSSDRLRRDKEYWDQIFESFPGKTFLKCDVENPSIKARRKTMLTPKKLTTKIYQYCTENKTSVFTLFLTALSMYINRVTTKENIVLGTTTLNRVNPKEKETAGMFNNITPMRIDVNDEMNFRGLVDSVTKDGMKLLRHQKYPYDMILKQVREKHKVSENIFDIVLNYQNSKFIKDQEEEYITRWHFNGYQVDSLHISINDRENEGHLIIDYDYQTELFHAKEIDFIHQNIINILWHALDNPEKLISKLEMLSEKEKNKILNEFNKTKIIYPNGFKHIFEEPGKKVPEKAKCYILDKKLNLLPIGIAGELYISGAGLSARKRRELGLSENAAVSNPFTPNDIIYKVGCIARWFPDGDLLYLGQIVSDKNIGSSGDKKGMQDIKVDIISTFTAEPISSYTKWWGNKFGYDFEIRFARYNQVFQELLNPNSMLAENTEGINVALIRFEDFIRYDNDSDEQKITLLDKTFRELSEAIDEFGSRVPLIIAIFPTSTHLGLSIHLQRKITEINTDFIKLLAKHKNIFVQDFTQLQNLYCIKEVFDALKDKEGHMPFSDEYYAAVGTEIARKICAIHKKDFKVIVLDCDNTLWKGICGEQGPLGVKVNEAYRELQQFMLQKYKEGILLAICSRNNEKDALEVFEKNPGMVLNKDHFVIRKINWKEKYSNILEIAQELNLGLEDFIFIDDDPLECSKMIENCPEVLTLLLPSDNAHIPVFLKHIWALDKERITNEDALRNSMYEMEKKRKESQNKGLSLENFMKNLHLKISMRIAGEREIERSAQLTQRTNQFNLSTIRRNEAEILQLMKDDKVTCFTVEASDKYGDYGIIGLVILKNNGAEDSLFLDTFLLSCRIFGRNVEDAVLTGIGRFAQEHGKQKVSTIFIPTEKNKPFHDFICRKEWKLIKKSGESEYYEISINNLPIQAENIQFYYNEMYNKDNEQSFIDKISPDQKGMETEKLKEINSPTSYDNSFYNDYLLSLIIHKKYIEPLFYLTGSKLLQIAPVGSTFDSMDSIEDDFQKRLACIWNSLLKTSGAGIDNDFFELGGDSLSAVILISRINREFGVELTLRDVFVYNTVRMLAEKIKESEKSEYDHIENIEQKEYYELSSAQKRMYILNRIESNSTGYNECHKIFIDGKLDKAKLEAAFCEFIKRHEIMRTSFVMLNDVPVQKVHGNIEFKIPLIKAKEKDINELTDNFIQPFDLSIPPLIRASLLEIGKERFILLLDIHHIIIDGTSFSILIKEIQSIYNDRELDPIKIQYKDFAYWQNTLFKLDKIKNQSDYWTAQFSDEVPVLNMPTDHLRPAVQSFNGRTLYFSLGITQVEKLKQLCRNSEVTMFMLLYAAFNVLLYRYTGQEDIVVGIPVSGRKHIDTRNIVGMFVNTLPIRTKPKADINFNSYLKDVKETIMIGLENQDFQYESLLDRINVHRELNRNPLFDIMFSLQNTDMPDIQLSGLTISHSKIDNRMCKFDISLLVVEKGEELEFGLEYCTDLFDEDSIIRMQDHYLNILKDISDYPHKLISEIEIMSDEEKNKILYEFNDTHTDYPKDKTIHQLFEEQVERTPDNVAVVFEDQQLTYSELNAKANQLARVLRNNGVKPEVIVAIMIERSMEMIIGILAILKAGGAYLPIDPDYPEERIKYMLEDSGAKILLIQENTVNIDFYGNTLLFELGNDKNESQNLKNVNKQYDLAYIIYTSGTTGKPKGVAIEHGSIFNTIYWRKNEYKLGESDSVLQLFPFCFDGFITSSFTPLVSGSRLVTLNKYEARDPQIIIKYLMKYHINNFIITPSFYLKLLDYLTPNVTESLKIVTLAGEKVLHNIIKKTNDKELSIELVNEYGPTECAVASTFLRNMQLCLSRITIGRPINNIKAYILDKQMNLVPIGVPGELYLAGKGVARGYINSKEITIKKFIYNIYDKNVFYKTGDIVKWVPNGEIEYIERQDNQVKIRGYRIDTGEIEYHLLQYSKVKEALVTDNQNSEGTNYLCAYLVSEAGLNLFDLKSYLSKKLPQYFIPNKFILVNELPLTNNGKINKNLINNSIKNDININCKEPTNDTERILVNTLKELLKLNQLGTDENLFGVGLDSLSIISAVTITLKFGLELSIQDFYRFQTVKELSDRLLDIKKINIINTTKIPSIKNLNTSLIYSVRNNNILLTGATGYLGAHILDSIISDTDNNIYCLIRCDNIDEAYKRLKEILHFYFGNKYESFLNKRIFIVKGDITKDKFGLSQNEYDKLGHKLGSIVHAAANVKHYGYYYDFHDTNVAGTNEIAKFASLNELRLHHISTTSVSGEYVENANENIIFSENDFYIGQSFNDSAYIKSKFDAENIILNAIGNGLNATIIRVGNLTGRYSDGKFQININNNAFYNLIKTFIYLKAIPGSILNKKLEFTPVDICSKGIIKIVKSDKSIGRVFHVMNHNTIEVKDLLSFLNYLPIKFKILDETSFGKYLLDTSLEYEVHKDIRIDLVNSIIRFEKNHSKNLIIVDSNITCDYLNDLGLIYPIINVNYFKKIINHMLDVGFLNFNDYNLNKELYINQLEVESI